MCQFVPQHLNSYNIDNSVPDTATTTKHSSTKTQHTETKHHWKLNKILTSGIYSLYFVLIYLILFYTIVLQKFMTNYQRNFSVLEYFDVFQ